jgi:hypothetical protein
MGKLVCLQHSSNRGVNVTANNSYLKTFTSAGDTYIIRPVAAEDFDRNLTYCENIPDATPTSVNFGLKPNVEALNLHGIYDIDDVRSSGFVVTKVNDGEPEHSKRVGLAIYGKHRKLYSHEFHMSIEQSLMTTTLPVQLFRVLVKHAKDHGIKVLFCHANEHNPAMQSLAEQAGMLVTLEPEQSHGVKYTLLLDKSPDILQRLAS